MTFKKLLEEKFKNGELVTLIKESTTCGEVCTKLGYSEHSRNKAALTEFVRKNPILSLNHFFKGGGKPATYEDRVCPVCNKVFTIISSQERERLKTTCSKECGNTYFKSGKRNPNYKGIEAKDYLVKADRYGLNECCVCGEKEVLDIHHIDLDPSNNEIANLLPVCPTHHAYIHRGKYFLIEEKILEYLSSIDI